MADVGDLIETAVAKPWLGMMVATGTVATSLGMRWLYRHDDGKPISLATKSLFGLALATFFIGGAFPVFRWITELSPVTTVTTPSVTDRSLDQAAHDAPVETAAGASPVSPTMPRQAELGSSATPPPSPTTSEVTVQIGALSSRALADGKIEEALQTLGDPAGLTGAIHTVSKNGTTLYRTHLTGFSSRDDARAACERLAMAGKSCFVK